MPGRADYVGALHAIGLESKQLSHSLMPSATWPSLWAGVPLTAAFLAPLLLTRKTIERALVILLCVAFFESIVSLIQFTQGVSSPLFFDSKFSNNRPVGTFNNRNHLADFFAMLISVWFYYFAHGNANRVDAGKFSQAFKPVFLMFGFGLLVMILLTQSRGGLIAGAFALLASSLILVGNKSSIASLRQKLALGALVGGFAMAAVFSVGLETATARFVGGQFTSDAQARNAYALSTLGAAKSLWPWGSGLGAFEAVFPRFQASNSLGYVEYAHNDYSQLLMELGVAGVLIAILLLVLVVKQLSSLYSLRRKSFSENTLRYLAGVGALTMLLHSWVEFNMHIPALAVTSTFLLGIFLRPSGRDGD